MTTLIYSLSILFTEWHWPDAPCPAPLPLSLSYLQSPEVWEAWEGQLHHPSTTSHSPDGHGVETRCVFRFPDISGISQFKPSGKTQSGVWNIFFVTGRPAFFQPLELFPSGTWPPTQHQPGEWPTIGLAVSHPSRRHRGYALRENGSQQCNGKKQI